MIKQHFLNFLIRCCTEILLVAAQNFRRDCWPTRVFTWPNSSVFGQSLDTFALVQRFSNLFILRTPKSLIYFLRTPEYCKQRINNKLATHEQYA